MGEKKKKKKTETKLFHEAFFRGIVGIKIYFPPNSSSNTIHTHQERNWMKRGNKKKKKNQIPILRHLN